MHRSRAGSGTRGPAHATTRAPFGRYGSPAARLTEQTLYVHPGGLGDHTTVQAAVTAAGGTSQAFSTGGGSGRTLVLAPGIYRETVAVGVARTEMTWIGASGDPRDVVVVYDNAAGTPRPGGGTYGTTGSATTTVQADGFTARSITFANDFLRADHPEITGTQAVAIKVQGDRSAFLGCRFLGHQDTLYADSIALGTFARQYYRDCYVEGDVDFVFGRATAVYERCHFHTLNRTDLAGPRTASCSRRPPPPPTRAATWSPAAVSRAGPRTRTTSSPAPGCPARTPPPGRC
ncbi:hypothetical protein SAV14893_060080 [Streptomyces avermitilis]|uniref:Pectinesterase n=1 Tax=Streptomyces avermitilis TaxID=33903 RepID=A0A4D4M432_STRAX|nr:hypothetical protein SAV14893_060080 [Streptomyces avermitilis]